MGIFKEQLEQKRKEEAEKLNSATSEAYGTNCPVSDYRNTREIISIKITELVPLKLKVFKNYDDDNKDDVLPLNETFEYDWKFNISKGAISSLDIILRIDANSLRF